MYVQWLNTGNEIKFFIQICIILCLKSFVLTFFWDPLIFSDTCFIMFSISKIFLGNPVLKYGCARCNKWYQWRPSLIRHLKYECGGNKGFQCPYCNKSCKQQYNLLMHVKNIHTDLLAEFMEYYRLISRGKMKRYRINIWFIIIFLCWIEV